MYLEWHRLLWPLQNTVLCHPKRERRNFQDADEADFISVPSLRAWEEVIMTYEPENSAKKLGVVRIQPASQLVGFGGCQLDAVYLPERRRCTLLLWAPLATVEVLGIIVTQDCGLLPCFESLPGTSRYRRRYC